MKGNITRAKNLDSAKPEEFMDSGDDDDDDDSKCGSAEQLGENWTNLQFSEAMSVLRKFLMRTYRKCQNCGSVNPKISKPTYGWFHVVSKCFCFFLLLGNYFPQN